MKNINEFTNEDLVQLLEDRIAPIQPIDEEDVVAIAGWASDALLQYLLLELLNKGEIEIGGYDKNEGSPMFIKAGQGQFLKDIDDVMRESAEKYGEL